MSNTVISVESLSKSYRLGTIGTGTFYNDLKVWWAQKQGKPNPLAKIEDVDYGNREGELIWALKDINFKVQQGEALGIIGSNGAGKSTLLKVLSRVTAPTTGEIKIKGRIASLLEVGTGFHPELTGRENIYLNGAILGMNRDEVNHKFDEIVDFSGVEQFIDTPVKRYSSGMYVRLAFAVAAHLEPEILVVDEVLAVGDAEFQKKCLGKMSDVAGEGRTVLFVSHNMASIEYLCKRVLTFSKGKILFSGDVNKGIQQYLDQNLSRKDVFLEPELIERKGKGNILFTSFHLENSSGNKIYNIISGKDIIFVFGYKAKSTTQNISIGFGIIDNLGKDLTALYNDYSSQVFPVLSGEGYIKCRINNFPLNSGTYQIKSRLSSNGNEEDYLMNGIGSIEVVKGDFYGTGKVIPDGKKSIPFLINGDWYLD